jgi:anti-anti-sigma regulatory factor
MRITGVDAGPPKVDDTMNAEPLGAGQAAARRGADGLMPSRDFALAVERLGNRTAVLVLAGELDLYRAPEIELALAQATEAERDGERHGQTCGAPSAGDATSSSKGVRRVAVDLRSVTFLDSTTLVLLLEASQRQRARGGELLILVGPQTPRTAFDVTGFDRLLSIRRLHVDPNGSPDVTAAHQPSREQEPEPSEMRHLATPGSLESADTFRRENDQLRTALVTRIVIEQAKGMLAERLAVEVDEAFERLRREARNRRMKLRALAVAVIAREPWTESAFQAARTEERGGTDQACIRKRLSFADDHSGAPNRPPKTFDRRAHPHSL